MMAAAKQSTPAALALVLLLACALAGSAQASRATSMHGPWIADGRSANYDVKITTGNWVGADFDGVSTPATMNNFYATPTTQWDKFWWRLETSSAVKCSRFDVTLQRQDTFASETRYFEDCKMYKDDSGCYVQYHRFFGDSLVMKWEYC